MIGIWRLVNKKRQGWNSNCKKSCLGLKKTTINQIMMVFKKVWSGVCQDKVQMYLPSPCTGRMLKSGLFSQGALSSLYPESEGKGVCWPCFLFITNRNGSGISPSVAESSPDRGSLFHGLALEETLQIGISRRSKTP